MSQPKTDSSLVPAGALLIALVTFAVYLPSLGSGFVNWDDPAYILDNARIRSINLELFRWVFVNVVNSNWHPLTIISYALDYSFWGTDPWGYHLVNIVFHSLNTFLVFYLALRLVGLKAPHGSKVPFAAAAVTAILFGLHPAHVESVSWVSERKDVLCGFFFILSILAYLKYAAPSAGKKLLYYFASLFAFVLAVMSKPMAITLPAVLLILDYYPLERLDRGKPRLFFEKAPFFLLAAVSGALTVWAQGSSGAFMTIENYPLVMRVFISTRGFTFYLYKLAFPLWLSPYYPPPLKANLLEIGFIASLISLVAITAATLVIAGEKKVFLAVWLFYVITLLPVVGVLQVGGQAAADRYTYIPGLGPFILVGVGFGLLFEKRYKVALPIVILLTGLLASKTIVQQAVWKTPLTLWSEAIRQYPESVPIIYNNRGLAYRKIGEYPKALEDFNRAVSINPSYFYTYISRGLLYGNMGRYDSAIADFDTASRLKPGYAEAYYYRAIAKFNLKRYPEVFEDLSTAIKLQPGFTDAYYKRGLAHLTVGAYPSAVEDFKKAVFLEPNNGAFYYNLGLAASKAGDGETASASFKRAAELGYKK
ncbi:MAG: tetratricopeptide repeat protein [Deltaproteobacteria bacterium]|nr:tetratricopeptide repeat protein [Deltaproteobacteria bacterium]